MKPGDKVTFLLKGEKRDGIVSRLAEHEGIIYVITLPRYNLDADRYAGWIDIRDATLKPD